MCLSKYCLTRSSSRRGRRLRGSRGRLAHRRSSRCCGRSCRCRCGVDRAKLFGFLIPLGEVRRGFAADDQVALLLFSCEDPLGQQSSAHVCVRNTNERHIPSRRTAVAGGAGADTVVAPEAAAGGAGDLADGSDLATADMGAECAVEGAGAEGSAVIGLIEIGAALLRAVRAKVGFEVEGAAGAAMEWACIVDGGG